MKYEFQERLEGKTRLQSGKVTQEVELYICQNIPSVPLSESILNSAPVPLVISIGNSVQSLQSSAISLSKSRTSDAVMKSKPSPLPETSKSLVPCMPSDVFAGVKAKTDNSINEKLFMIPVSQKSLKVNEMMQ